MITLRRHPRGFYTLIDTDGSLIQFPAIEADPEEYGFEVVAGGPEYTAWSRKFRLEDDRIVEMLISQDSEEEPHAGFDLSKSLEYRVFLLDDDLHKETCIALWLSTPECTIEVPGEPARSDDESY